MRTLYLECNMGAAGDMLLSALYELLPEPEQFIEELCHLNIPMVKIIPEKRIKCGIAGTHINIYINDQEEESCDVAHLHHHHYHEDVHEHTYHHHDNTHEHMHHHSHEEAHEHTYHHDNEHDSALTGDSAHFHASLGNIINLIESLPLSEAVKKNAKAVYLLVAEAEAHAHDTEIEKVHFHEVGAMDAVVDIVGVCMAIEKLGVEQIICSPICTGFGEVKCAHGILPVPTPATTQLLRGIPVYAGRYEGEMCTPTGAALLKHFVNRFIQMPMMCIEKIGIGTGKKDFPAANIIRALLGDEGQSSNNEGQNKDQVVMLSCNVDDMTGEEMGFATELLLAQKALDVFTVPVYMKKNRPGMMLCCLCEEEQMDFFIKLILKHTTTLGVRKQNIERYKLEREEKIEETFLGEIPLKVSRGIDIYKEKYEYEVLRKVALEKGLSIRSILTELLSRREEF